MTASGICSYMRVSARSNARAAARNLLVSTRLRDIVRPVAFFPVSFFLIHFLPRTDKSEQGQECAINHPLPVNADGSPMSESQYKAYRQSQRRLKREPSWSGYPSGEEDELELGNGSGMEDYDRV